MERNPEVEQELDEMLQGAERIRIVQLLPAPEGWRLVRASRLSAEDGGGWEVEALPVLCWALTHRTNTDGVVDHGVEAVICDDGVMLLPHHEIDEAIDFLAPGVPFVPEVVQASLEHRGQP